MEDEATLPGDGDLGGAGDEGDRLVERLQVPAGMLDPNIIGDAGPTDVPPGSDPPLDAAPPDQADEDELP